MKVLVPVKRVIDYNVKARPMADGSAVDLANVKMAMNPFDEIAVEEAIRLKEKGTVSEVVVVSIGDDKVQEQIRAAIAVGVDRGIHVKADDVIQPLAAAKILQKVVEAEQPNMVIMGKQAIDDDANQTGQMLAAILGWGQGTFASEVTIDGDSVQVTREVDGGLMTVGLKLPCVVTTDLRLNEPRYAKLPDIMKARSKPLDTKVIEELGVDVAPRVDLVKVEEPPQRSGGVMVKDVDELVDKLKNEAKVV